MKKTLGGDRLGSGKKMEVDLHTYNRSTHDLSYIFRTTMSTGTLVPFLCQVGLPGDDFDIDLNLDMKTHPTVGPLFGSHKIQCDVFEAPIRLYNSYLHNNRLKIGLNMSQIKLPLYKLTVPPYTGAAIPQDKINNSQINPSCILAYLGVRGVGFNGFMGPASRRFNAVPLLAYWDIYKNYYANKQEERGYVAHTPVSALVATVTNINAAATAITPEPGVGSTRVNTPVQISAAYTGATPIASQIMFNTTAGRISMEQMCANIIDTGTALNGIYQSWTFGDIIIQSWGMRTPAEVAAIDPQWTQFPLENIDTMRNNLLAAAGNVAFDVNLQNLTPYSYVLGTNADGYMYSLGSQEGLGIKTYQSDIFNNWLKTEYIDGAGGISEVTSIDTSGGSFSIDTLNIASKVYNMLNRIAASGGSYKDWLDAVYQETRYNMVESPIYHGSLIKELVFQEVISNASSDTTSGEQALGTLAGRGVLAHKHKGGQMSIKCQEPSYIIGLVSITPRLDYSQGNAWDCDLVTMDDFHKPALDEIGFEDLITERMAWFDTQYNAATLGWDKRSAGKQPAWINYMTNFNKTYGNFAIPTNEMFMTLNRNYEWEPLSGRILDITTYIDPAKWNSIFASTRFDSQNFWCQIAVNMTSRRLMSARIMPNL